MTEWWRPTFQTTVDAFYQGDLAAGLAACEQLNAAKGLPERIEELTRGNLVFYTPTLASLVPSFAAQRIEIPVPEGWSCYNPSIAAAKDGFRLILRSGNYRVDPPLRYTVNDDDGVVRTTNYLLDLSPDLSIVSAQAIDDRAFRPATPAFPVAGFEDCRLIRHHGDWWVSATVRDRAANGVSRIALLRLSGATATQEFPLSDGDGRSEKNWMPVVGGKALRFVYSCSPTTVLQFDRKRGVVVPDRREKAPWVARHFRGGSQVIPFDDGHLCLIHEVIFTGDGGRRYLHRWVWFDRKWRLRKISPPFVFHAAGIEFAAGLARRGGQLVISYGVWDREAWLATVETADVLALLHLPLKPKEAARLIRATSGSTGEEDATAAPLLFESDDGASKPDAASPANQEPPEWWRPAFQTTVDAYYRGQLDAGRKACELLLSADGLPDHISAQVHRNLVYYAPKLETLVASAAHQRLSVPHRPNWSATNPSLAVDGDGYRVIVRSSNYRYHENVMQMTVDDPQQIIRTENFLLELGANFDIKRCEPIADGLFRPEPPPYPVTGFEDCRLFSLGGKWWAIASARDRNERGVCQAVLLRLDERDVAAVQQLSDSTGRREKNWMPVLSEDGTARFIYSCSPTVIVRWDEEADGIVPELIQPGAPIARRFSGGSQAIPLDDGYLCLVHETVRFADRTRLYMHRWVWFDAAWQLVRLSEPFVFQELGVEFAAGLARRDDQLIVSYGVWDREAWLATMSVHEVMALLAPPIDSGAALAEVLAYHAFSENETSANSNVQAPPGVTTASANGAALLVGPRMNGRPRIISTTLSGNSRKIIGAALSSVVDWVDCCLIIDTGITDNTLDVAREIAGSKLVVRQFPWCNDFAAARNYALQAALELGADWAVTLDTDERIDLSNIDIHAELMAAASDTLLVKHANGTYAKERVFRLPAPGQFVGPTHEAFVRQRGGSETLAHVRFDERGKSAKRYRQKAERDVEILTRHTLEHPDDPRWFYYLGDSLAGLDRHEEAVAAFRACAALNGWDEESGWAMYRAASCLIKLNRQEEAIAACVEGLSKHSAMPELPWLAALASWNLGQADEAVRWARQAAELGDYAGAGTSSQRIGFRYLPALWEGPFDVLRFALRQLGDEAGANDAEQMYQAALEARKKLERKD